MADSDEEIDRLLARGRLAGPVRERILDGALRAAQPPRRRWQWLTLALAAPAAALGVLVIVRSQPQFRARGGAAPALLDVRCAGGSGHRCRSGDMLVFSVGGAGERSVLTAWAEPVGGGERVWYFSAEGRSPEVVPQPTVQTLSQAARLGAQQPPGAYTVHLLLSRRPLPRAEALHPGSDVLATTTVALEVTP